MTTTTTSRTVDLRESLTKSPGGRGDSFFRIDRNSATKQSMELTRDSLKELIQHEASLIMEGDDDEGDDLRNSLHRSPSSCRKLKVPTNFLQKCRASLRQINGIENKKEIVARSFREQRLSLNRTSMPPTAPSLVDLTIEESESFVEHFSDIDIEEQRKLMEECEQRKRASEGIISAQTDSSSHSTSQNTTKAVVEPSSEKQEHISITPGNDQALRNSTETFQAILEGRVVNVVCSFCSDTLTCIEDAEYYACSDCWVINRIHKKRVYVADGKEFTCYGVCVGVKDEDIAEWLATQHE